MTSKGQMDERAYEAGSAATQEMEHANPIDVHGLTLAAAAAVGAYEPWRGSADEEALTRCVTIDLTEMVEKLVIDDGGVPGVGTTVDYVDGLYDSAGRRAGTITGNALVLAMTPHMWQFHKSVVELEDGSIEAVGVIDATAVVHEVTQIFRVTGLSGRYVGKSGWMTLVVSDPAQKPPHFRTTMALF